MLIHASVCFPPLPRTRHECNRGKTGAKLAAELPGVVGADCKARKRRANRMAATRQAGIIWVVGVSKQGGWPLLKAGWGSLAGA